MYSSFVSFILLHLFWVSLAIPQSEVAIVASKDNTLYEDDAGGLSNGLGAYFFTGKNSGTKIRRGLVFFDLAEKIAAGASITAAYLRLNLSRTSSPAKLSSCTKCWAIGEKAPRMQTPMRVEAPRPRRMMPHGFIVSLTRIRGIIPGVTFLRQQVPLKLSQG